MRHSLMTESPSPLMPQGQFAMMHHTQQPTSAAVTTAAAVSTTLASELIHASLVAATQSSQPRDHSSTTNTTNNNNNNNDNNATTKKSRNSCVAAPKMSRTTLATLEYSIHVSPRRFTRDLETVFPNKDLTELLVVPTFQKCLHEMVVWNAEIAKEKDDRLED
ncbi:hypothetical protein BGZ58_001508, partial [Dissophora ornata]